MQKTLNNIIGENQTAAIKNRTILHTVSTIQDITDVSNKLNKNFISNITWFPQSFRLLRFELHVFGLGKVWLWSKIHTGDKGLL